LHHKFIFGQNLLKLNLQYDSDLGNCSYACCFYCKTFQTW